MVQHIHVDLSRPPEERWAELSPFAKKAGRLADSYVKDLGGLELFAPLLGEYRRGFVSDEYGREMDAIANMIGRPAEHVLIANLYYDAFRAILGCTAFGIDTPTGPIHARNLDWWTESNMLSDYTIVAEVGGGSCPSPYQIVTWPGSIGVFSAVSEGRFAITLNAVISAETPQLAESITLLLRRIFDTARDYDAALRLVADTPIAADCLLLVTGTQQGQMAVIERTSTKSEVRDPEDGLVVVTNDYRKMHSGFAPSSDNILHATACSRFDRARALASAGRPIDAAACLEILQDDEVKMGITVQHMVMQASTGLLEIRLPPSGLLGAARKMFS